MRSLRGVEGTRTGILYSLAGPGFGSVPTRGAGEYRRAPCGSAQQPRHLCVAVLAGVVARGEAVPVSDLGIGAGL